MPGYTIRALRYPSFYLRDFEAAVAFYTRVFGEPAGEEAGLKGWQLGDTWLTLFPAEGLAPAIGVDPRNSEFAVEVSAPAEVDALYADFLAAGAKSCMPPEDTVMYVPMRFAVVDDPFGIRVDVFCPLPSPVEDPDPL